MTPLELERAVLLASDATSPQRWEATNVLNQWISNSNSNSNSHVRTSVSVPRALLTLLNSTRDETVLFYVLTTLQKCIKDEQLTLDEKVELRGALLQLAAIPTTTATATSTSRLVPTAPFLKTKVAVVLAALIRVDFPYAWPGAFETLQQHTAPEMWLRTIDALQEDFVEGDTTTTKIKDAMRGLASLSSMAATVTTTTGVTGSATPLSATGAPTVALIPLEQTIVARMVEYILYLLGHYYPQTTTVVAMTTNTTCNQNSTAMAMVAREADQVCALTFSVLKSFLSWIDCKLVVQESVLVVLFGCMGNPSTSATDISVPAVACLEELVHRGMPSVEAKIKLLADMQLFQRIHDSGVNLDTLDASPIEVVIEVAKLIAMAGLQLLPLWDEQLQQASCSAEATAAAVENAPSLVLLSNMIPQLMNLFFRCFAYDDIDVSGAVISLASRLTITLGKELRASQRQGTDNAHATTNHSIVSNHLPQLLATMYRQMKYPADFEFDHEDEEEAEEEMYRTHLRKLNQNLVRIYPDVCLQFLCEALSNLPAPLSTCPTPDIEAALRLVYHYCEGIRPSPGLKVVMKNETFRTVLIALHGSDITCQSHREVLLLYYDIAVRYHPIFKEKPEFLPGLLGSLSGEKGLQHSHSRVRCRSCYLLLRLVKSLSSTTTSSLLLKPYVETAVSGIQGLLSNPATYPLLRPEDTLYLFETIGLLVGKTGLEPIQQQHYLTNVMTPHVQSIEEALVLLRSNTNNDQEQQRAVGTQLSHSIAAIAYLSKGFTKQPSPEIQVVLLETVTIALAVLEALPENDLVRGKTMILIQRMIQCFGNDKGKVLLPSMPRLVLLLIEHCTTEDVLDVAQLLNQLCLKFKDAVVPAIDAALLPFLRKCHTLMPNTEQVVDDVFPAGTNNNTNEINIPPHLLTEQLSIKKLTFCLLQYVVSYRATAVLLSSTNVSALESVLQTMKDGAIFVEDPIMKKACITFFRDLVDQWAGTSSAISYENPLVQRGFLRFAFEVFLPGMIKCILDPMFNDRDAMQARNVSEFGNVLMSLKTCRGLEEFEQYVLCGLLSSSNYAGVIRCPPNIIAGFRAASNGKEMDICLKEMMKELKPAKR